MSKKMGSEVARNLEASKKTIWERMLPEWQQIRAALWGVVVFFVLFLVGMWLAGNPFEFTVRLPSEFNLFHGLTGDQWMMYLVEKFFSPGFRNRSGCRNQGGAVL